MSRSLRTVGAVLAGALISVAVASVAEAAHSGSANLPNGCSISGDIGYDGTYAIAQTFETANCSHLDTKMRWFDFNNGIWVTSDSGYQPLSYVDLLKLTNVTPLWSDHNGKHTSGGTAYGFRLNW